MRNVTEGKRYQFRAKVGNPSKFGSMPMGSSRILLNLEVLKDNQWTPCKSHSFVAYYEEKLMKKVKKGDFVTFKAFVRGYPGLNSNGEQVLKKGLYKIREVKNVR